MGDLIGTTVEGALYYAARDEFARIKRLAAPPEERIALYADVARLNTLYMIARAGSGHIGSSFSSLDIVSWLYTLEMDTAAGDCYFSSKGHDAPGLYAVLSAEGLLAEDQLHRLRRLGGLPGHPDVSIAGVNANTGSLGMGISKAKGMAIARRHLAQRGRIFVLTGDGELQEGQIWESLLSAANQGLGEIVAIVDHNKIQSDFSVNRTSSLGDLAAKFRAFDWSVQRCDGHDIAALAAALRALEQEPERPKVIIADTIKGRGVTFMEGTSIDSDVEMFRFHSGAPQANDYRRAAQELIDRCNTRLASLGAPMLRLEVVDNTASTPAAAAAPTALRLFPAYTAALIAAAERDPRLVVLDADLVVDMGLVSFSERFPTRFVECGIAEMDMVSQAGAMARQGLLPIVHSFACFLSTRPNEQIYNNASEASKIVYVGGLAGVIPGGPGHSHQGIRDIAALRGIPGLSLLEPSCPEEVAPLLDWALTQHTGSSYLRMTSIPYVVPFTLPADYRPSPGRGVALTDGADAVLIAYGMVLLSEAVKAAGLLRERGLQLRVINMPWLNRLDGAWLATELSGVPALCVLDNHYLAGGVGEFILAAVAELGLTDSLRCCRFGIEGLPPCGSNDEVLQTVGLDALSLASAIAKWLGR